MDNLKAGQVREILGISQTLLSQWHERRLIKASTPASGSGTRNFYSITDVCQIRLFQVMISNGYRRRYASDVAYSRGFTPTLERMVKEVDEYQRSETLRPTPLFILLNQTEDELIVEVIRDGQHAENAFLAIADKGILSNVINVRRLIEETFERVKKVTT